ncbi:glycosyl hydrolases family 16-domain-containing protein [Pterulicium gracile]|uniref:Glycosyl hydrolases family 16-domain-containing protein n=1 Tax=Pterulicium gracile TaxID=1884261 RepID=A0A5C3QY06_9AGAR|nr:glycosyl hydrolases family 16-domain-containing protein [Pterula gracilis]
MWTTTPSSILLSLLFLSSVLGKVAEPKSRKTDACQPRKTTFSSSRSGYTPIKPSTISLSHQGIELHLARPEGKISVLKDGTNDKQSVGATVNSTFSLWYGKVSFEISAPTVPGVITAAILISDSSNHQEEIDIEILGSQPHAFQTNVFAPAAKDKGEEPLYGVLGGTSKLKGSETISDLHRYTIDWNKDRIIWTVDGKHARTLKKNETTINGALHYPSHPMRLQFGIWDASSPVGTSEWAGGPIKWNGKGGSHLGTITAVVRSIEVECP